MDAMMAFDGRRFDLDLSALGDLTTDLGLYTAVVVSLFTDRRADPDDVLPDGVADRRGWWGDAFAEIDGDRIGSRLWLLGREKHLPEVAARARRYAEEALAWLVEDGIATRVVVAAERQPNGRLAMGIEIHRPAAAPVTYRFNDIWEAVSAI